MSIKKKILGTSPELEKEEHQALLQMVSPPKDLVNSSGKIMKLLAKSFDLKIVERPKEAGIFNKPISALKTDFDDVKPPANYDEMDLDATMFTDVPLLGRYEKAAKVGFKLVEVPFPYSIPASELKKEADRNNISHVLINAPVGNFEGENLIFANDIFEKEGIQLLIEPINSYTIPGYFLNSMDQAVSILDKVKSENVKILFDVFHIQQIHGQITGLVKRFEGKIGHIQVAQVPDRHEPDSPGELDYKYVFNLLSSVNVNWTIGCEYFNSGTT
ncbi:hypothetical protein FO519_008089, partial [Halicephalobus sp. NKZ332]